MTQDELTLELLCEASDRLEMILERIENDIMKDHPYITWEYETAKNSLNKINNFLTKIGAVDNMKISYESYSHIEDFVLENDDTVDGNISDEMAFQVLDSAFGGLVPEQDVDTWGGTYEWVCDYAGGKFYAPIHTTSILDFDGI